MSVSAILDRHGPDGPGAYASGRFRISKQRLQRIVTDVLWVLFLVGATSAANSLGPPNAERYFWFAADLAVAGLLVTRTQDFLRVIAQNKLLISWPLLACASTLWSLAPFISIYHGLQLLMTTLTAFALLMFEGRAKVIQLIFFALLACAIGSLLFTLLRPAVALGAFGEWRGLFHHKNQLGVYSALLAICGICLFLQGWHRFISGFGIGLGLALLALSKSGSALVCLIVALAPLPLAISYRQGLRALASAMGVLCILVSLVILIVGATGTNLIDDVLVGLGKDRTLTGRLILWDLGTRAFLDDPWLGSGYKGYWEGLPAAVSHLRLVMGQDLWFFHNNVLEVAVAFGIIGPVLLLAGIGQALVRTIRAFMRDGQYTSLWGLLIVLFLMVYMNAENPLFQNHSFPHLLFVIAAAAYFGPSARAKLAPAR